MTTAAGLPRLAIFYEPDSVSPMRIAAAATDAWATVWVVDSDDDDTRLVRRLLGRLGTVVDVSGADAATAAETIGRERPEGIVAFADGQLPRVAAVAAELGLPYYDAAVVQRLTNKVAQRAALAAGGISVPGYWAVAAGATPAERAAVEAEVRYPAVLKPQAGNGSRDTYAVDDASTLRQLIDEMFARTHPVDFIVEERLTDSTPRHEQVFGDYVSVETVVVDGRVYNVGLTGRFPLVEPFRESGFFAPAALDTETGRDVLVLAERAIEAVGVEWGALHTEVKLTPAGPRIIEVNGRLGGGMSDVLELAGGPSLFTLAGRMSLGIAPSVDCPAPCDRIGYLLYLQAPVGAGRIESLEGLADAGQLPGVEEVLLNCRPGESLDWREGNHGYLCSVLGSALDHDELLKVRAEVLSAVKPTYR